MDLLDIHNSQYLAQFDAFTSFISAMMAAHIWPLELAMVSAEEKILAVMCKLCLSMKGSEARA